MFGQMFETVKQCYYSS